MTCGSLVVSDGTPVSTYWMDAWSLMDSSSTSVYFNWMDVCDLEVLSISLVDARNLVVSSGTPVSSTNWMHVQNLVVSSFNLIEWCIIGVLRHFCLHYFSYITVGIIGGERYRPLGSQWNYIIQVLTSRTLHVEKL